MSFEPTENKLKIIQQFMVFGAFLLLPLLANADETEIAPIEITAGRPVIDSSVDTFAQPISQLRFDPRVDVQSRNLIEAQGDVTSGGGFSIIQVPRSAAHHFWIHRQVTIFLNCLWRPIC